MSYFERKGDGSYGEIPTEGLKLVDGREGGEGRKAVIAVREDSLHYQYVKAITPGPDFVIYLARDGVVPSGVEVCNVWRQGVRIRHEPTGREINVDYARDY